MSWDIYGNPLRRGHCEVHPHVHEEYPCSVCMAEKRQQLQPEPYYNVVEQLQSELAEQGEYIRRLESERNTLASLVQVLRDENAKYFGWWKTAVQKRKGEY